MSDNVCQESLACDLIRIGLVPGDMVYVHSSMKKIGWIQGGPEALVQAFLEVLGPEGTLAVPTHTLSFPGRGAEPFDAMSTPTVLGLFPEIVRRYPGALRSGHASHSSAAIGAKASFLTKGHDPCHALAEQSPLYRLCRNGGRILLIGVDNTSNTSIHLAESLAEMPYTSLPYDASWGNCTAALLEDGTVHTYLQREYPGCSEQFEVLESLFEKAGIVKKGMIGNAPSRLIEAGPMLECVIHALQKNPMLLLCTDQNCPCCPARRDFMHQVIG